jgi:hypothetical protein
MTVLYHQLVNLFCPFLLLHAYEREEGEEKKTLRLFLNSYRFAIFIYFTTNTSNYFKGW